MLPLQFFSQNLHFAISLFAALVFFAMFWLYIDAWTDRKQLKELCKWLGCLLLSLAYLLIGTIVEGSILNRPVFGEWTLLISILLQVIAYAALIYGQIIDPLQPVPKTEGLVPEKLLAEDEAPKEEEPAPSPVQEKEKEPVSSFGIVATISAGIKWLPPLGAGMTSYLYWRRATTGLERHLKPVAIGFGLVAVSGLVGLSSLGRGSTNPVIYNLVAPYGWLWWLEHILLMVGASVLGRWVWQYLVKRFFSQIFMIFTAMAVGVFMVTTMSFSFLLVRSVQADTLNSLESAANSLRFAIDSRKSETISSAEVVAGNPQVAAAITAKDHDSLVRLAGGYLESKKLSSLMVVTSAGQVLLRAEDPSRWGDSISDDPLVARAASGLTTASVSSRDDVLAPLLFFRSSVPVKNATGQVVGVVIAGVIADTAFVDGIKQATGMDASVYSTDVRSATTLLGPDGKSRLIGIKENNAQVKNTVLEKGESYKGVISLLNQPYLAVYAPLKNYDNTVAGMLLVGRPHTYILETAGRSIQLTFLIAALMIALSVIPAYIVARHIARQVR
jgi:hypothetical protein